MGLAGRLKQRICVALILRLKTDLIYLKMMCFSGKSHGFSATLCGSCAQSLRHQPDDNNRSTQECRTWGFGCRSWWFVRMLSVNTSPGARHQSPGRGYPDLVIRLSYLAMSLHVSREQTRAYKTVITTSGWASPADSSSEYVSPSFCV